MILTKTTELGLNSILFLAQQPTGYLVNPQELAGRLHESPTYMAKVLRLLARADLIRSHRGAAGGFELIRAKENLTLLDVVEACQGPDPWQLLCGSSGGTGAPDVRISSGYART
jgi:Rrf2 family protein